VSQAAADVAPRRISPAERASGGGKACVTLVRANRVCYKGCVRFAVLLLALGLTACTGDAATSPSGPVDRRIVLAPGQTTLIPEAGIRLRFEGVFGDSRCPANALCVWAGDATVRLVVQLLGEAPANYDLHTIDLKSVRHRDVTVALETLSPYPFDGRPIAPGDYRATLRITR
jgi:hypothetical protein